MKNEFFHTWLTRYLPPEIFAIPTAIFFSHLVLKLTNNLALAAIVGAWSENIAYYGFLFLRDLRNRKTKINSSNRLIVRLFGNAFGLIVEFGPAEIVDSIFTRPILIYIFSLLFNNLTIGLVIAKILSDILFVVIAYLSRKFAISKIAK